MNHRASTLYAATLAVGLGLVLAGCATVMSGSYQDVRVTSTPSGAQVSIQRAAGSEMAAVWQGTTPAVASLERKHSYVLRVVLDGYRPVETTLETGTNGWIWGNLLFGGVVGVAVDLSTGAWKKLRPDEVDVQLVTMSSLTPSGREDVLYAVFRAMSDDGHLSTSAIPLVPRSSWEAGTRIE